MYKLLNLDKKSYFKDIKYLYGKGQASEKISEHISRTDFKFSPLTFEDGDINRIVLIKKPISQIELEQITRRLSCTVKRLFNHMNEPILDIRERVTKILISGKMDALMKIEKWMNK